MIKPVRVSADVPQSREAVYEFLDVMSNHESFTEHALKEWSCSGPERGVGSKAAVSVHAAGRRERIEIEVVSARAPREIVERNVGAGGRRVANGTYYLEERPGGGTHIVFEYAWQAAPLSERLAAPLVRATLRRVNERAMERLAEQLAAHATATPVAPDATG
jgi:carbon monoxide dehydrogenase subunit G